jgi:hypothetical protein
VSRSQGDRPWTEADVEAAADLEHPPSPEVIARVMPIVRAALARPGSGGRRRNNTCDSDDRDGAA